MCGIVGMLQTASPPNKNQAVVKRMLGTIRHRGPDEFGVYAFSRNNDSAALGSARLSILDIQRGHQPMSNENKTMWIVFNGEIFNHGELKRALQKKGHQFSTHSDTEVIVHAFEEYGPNCVQHLNGQFAFAIWDENKRRLFLARDRVGIRPLFYSEKNGAFLFASEIKAILAHPNFAAQLDRISLDQIFTFWSVLSPRTAFSGIHTLPPGHWMQADCRGIQRIERYWNLEFPASGNEPIRNLEQAIDQLEQLLTDATHLRLRADVPVGAYLSGGLDSSTLTSMIRHHSSNRLETFSIAFTDERFDESGFQKAVADSLGTYHHMITCTHKDIGQVFPDVIWHTETPILRTSPAPMFLLSRLVRDRGFKVVLTGEGADEVFAGYNIFKELKVRRFWARQVNSTTRPALLRRLYAYIEGLSWSHQSYSQAFFGRSLGDVDRATFSHQLRWRNTARCKRFFSDDFRAEFDASKRYTWEQPENESKLFSLPDQFARWSPLARSQYLEATIFMPEYLLSSQGDRMCMAHSVEGRFPFLDHRVIEFGNRLKPQLKLFGLNEKHVLKQAAKRLLPPLIWNRRKRPFRAPICASFFPNSQPMDWVADVISQKSLIASGCFNPKAVTMLIRKLERTGKLSETDDMALAGLISTQLVYRKFVERPIPCNPIADNENVETIVRS